MGAGLLAVESGFILFINNYQFPLQINTLERERERERERDRVVRKCCLNLMNRALRVIVIEYLVKTCCKGGTKENISIYPRLRSTYCSPQTDPYLQTLT
jgi:hypothetical protein